MRVVEFPLWQLTGTVLSVIFAVIMGIVLGLIASRLGRKEMPYDDKEEIAVDE